ncbi:MAG: hypothetical protein LCH81_12400 [Bacteroidetes bacterium]|nr:hypothetical protein [Bacteroidota bacterium]
MRGGSMDFSPSGQRLSRRMNYFVVRALKGAVPTGYECVRTPSNPVRTPYSQPAAAMPRLSPWRGPSALRGKFAVYAP